MFGASHTFETSALHQEIPVYILLLVSLLLTSVSPSLICHSCLNAFFHVSSSSFEISPPEHGLRLGAPSFFRRAHLLEGPEA